MNEQLETKIRELFKYRKLPSLFKLAGTSKKEDSKFYDQLIALQTAIYELDLYLESNWKLDYVILEEKWSAIYECLSKLKVPKKKQVHYVRQILKYQEHELVIRKGKLPTSLTMEYFYFYKSCDVKLIRKLIFDRYPILKKSFKLSDWRLFDLVTELVDDLTDIEEDTLVYNGNRFLISYIVKKKKKTFADFDHFLNDIDDRISAMKTDTEVHQKIKKWTVNVVHEADDILDEIAANFPSKAIKKSLIAKKIKK